MPPTGGYSADGRLRIRTESPLASTVGNNGTVAVTFNNVTLVWDATSAAMFPPGVQANKSFFPEDLWAAWVVPSALVRKGTNTIALQLHAATNTGVSASTLQGFKDERHHQFTAALDPDGIQSPVQSNHTRTISMVVSAMDLSLPVA